MVTVHYTSRKFLERHGVHPPRPRSTTIENYTEAFSLVRNTNITSTSSSSSRGLSNSSKDGSNVLFDTNGYSGDMNDSRASG